MGICTCVCILYVCMYDVCVCMCVSNTLTAAVTGLCGLWLLKTNKQINLAARGGGRLKRQLKTDGGLLSWLSLWCWLDA